MECQPKLLQLAIATAQRLIREILNVAMQGNGLLNIVLARTSGQYIGESFRQIFITTAHYFVTTSEEKRSIL